MKIHHNHIDGMGQSGMYLGSTDPNGGRTITCGGAVTSPWPLRLGNFQIHNNVVENTNRTGIQLSGAEFGTSAIHDNTIRRTGLELNNQQGSGIALGGYTRADVLNNTIQESYNAGILVLGAGPVTVRGNSISNSGNVAGNTAPGMAGIMVDVRPTTPFTRLQLTIRNNTIGANTDAGVRVYRSLDGYAATNMICQNTGTQAIDPNVSFSATCP
jgi:parallel beta-helix repeat protein